MGAIIAWAVIAVVVLGAGAAIGNWVVAAFGIAMLLAVIGFLIWEKFRDRVSTINHENDYAERALTKPNKKFGRSLVERETDPNPTH
jgi:membrane protein implicated in regulation of membrane protease activity